MIELILASSNQHKAQEFSELCDPNVVVVVSAKEKIDVDETGNSYFANALLKAEAYYQKYKKPILADDSGLNVEALPDELGVTSARFGGEGLSDKDRAQLLLSRMDAVTNRSAYFTCVLCVYINEKEVFYFEGRLSGSIAYSYRGQGGFGYDPVFIPLDFASEGLTVAELSEWKQKNSHRAIALGFAQKFLGSRKV